MVDEGEERVMCVRSESSVSSTKCVLGGREINAWSAEECFCGFQIMSHLYECNALSVKNVERRITVSKA